MSPGAAEFALPVKPIDAFLRGWERLMRAGDRAAADLSVSGWSGGGAGGVELALATQYRLRTLLLVERGDDPERLEYVSADPGPGGAPHPQ
jgi:selenide, water dikinase